MHKLIIIIEEGINQAKFETHWPGFLKSAEAMPGLLRETSSWVEGLLFGVAQPHFIHELYFKDRTALEDALESEMGQSAGRMLHFLTDGHMTLLFAQHQEDDPANFQPTPPAEAAGG